MSFFSLMSNVAHDYADALWTWLKGLSPVDPQGHDFDHILTPQYLGETLVGHDGETDRFVFDNPSLSPDLTISAPAKKDEYGNIVPVENMDLGGRDPIFFWGDFQLMTPAVQIKNFNPEEGDVLDFSALPQVSSYLGHAPSPHAVWTEEYNEYARVYPMHIDLDGDPTSVDMGLYIHFTAADQKNGGNNDSITDIEGYEVNLHKTLTDGVFLFA